MVETILLVIPQKIQEYHGQEIAHAALTRR
jgi:hypothetical protein